MVTASEIQHTRIKGELPFQNFVLKLIRAYWKDDYAEPHGRKGHKQHGADITGRDYRNGYMHAAVQCKASETDEPRRLTEQELIEEINQAKTFTPKLDIFIVAFGGDRDPKLQRKVQELNAVHEEEGLFRIVLWSWDDIVQRALDFDEVVQQLVLNNQVPVGQTLDPRRPKTEIFQELRSMHSALVNLETAIERKNKNAEGDLVLTGKLDVFRDQLRAGRGEILIEELREFVAQLPEDTHSHQRFRAYANLGSALAQAGELESACVAFDTAAAAEPGTADSHANRARAAYLRGKNEIAFKEATKALAMERNRLAATILLEAAPSIMTAAELEELVGDLAQEVEVASSLVSKYANARQHADAVRVARAIAKRDWQRDGAVGQAILGQYEDDIELRMGAPMSADQALQIDEARSHLERAWTQAKKRHDKKRWIFIAANLSSAYRLLGLDEKSEALILEVFALNPHAPSVAQRATLAFVRKGEFGAARAAMDSVLEDSTDSEDYLLAGSVALSAKDWPVVEAHAKRALELAASDSDRASACEMLVLSKFQSGTPGDAIPLADEYRTTFEPNISFEARVAEIARRLGDTDELDRARKRLSAFGKSEDLSPLDRFALADAYADDNRWSAAADLLHGLHAYDRPSEILKRRLFALYRADRRSDARALFDSLQPSALKSPELLRLGAAIYERSGLLTKALDALDNALEINPEDLRSRLDWARICIRDDKENRVRAWIRRAPIPTAGEADDLLEAAQLFDRYSRSKDGMLIGYATLQKHWGSSERIHMMYMSLILVKSKGIKFLHPKIVAEDSVVFLEDEHGVKTHYKIETASMPTNNVLKPSHPFSARLLGKKTGESVILDEGIGQPITWTIIDIKHKFLDLLHRSIEAHATLFPGSRSLGQFHIDLGSKETFEPIFEHARERARMVNEALKLYTTNVMPIDGVAKMLGLDPIDASRGLRFNSGALLDTCVGAHEERVLAFENLNGATSVLVDALTLSLWDEIEFLPLMAKLPIKVEVVQATLDALLMRADDARRAIGEKSSSLEAQGEKLTMIQVPTEYKERLLKAADALLEWVRTNAKVIPTEHVDHEDADQLAEFFSNSSFGTCATASATGAPAIIEDRRLRSFAASIGARRLSWTPAIPYVAARSQLYHPRRLRPLDLPAWREADRLRFRWRR
jgi:tetratricopeptide (TPR) repeat protein